MTARERPASGGAVLAQRPPTPRPSLTTPTPPAPSSPPVWADLLHGLTASQQHDVLDLAARQGIVYGHQLPAVDAVAARRPPLASLLAGRQPDLPAAVITPRPLHDAALDPYQQQAVWRALQSPDVALIHGHAGTGKSRVAAEILRQAAEQHLRVLFVAPAAAALDQALRRVHDHPAILALRCLHGGETHDHLPREIQTLTLDGRLRQLREDAVRAARAAEAAADKHVEHLGQMLTLSDRWESLDRRADELAKQQAAVTARSAGLADEIARDDASAEIQAVQAQREQEQKKQRLARAEIEQKQNELATRLQPLQREHSELEPLVRARQAGQWWTGSWWRAALRGDALKRYEELAQQLRQLDGETQQLKDKLAALDSEARRLDGEFADKLTALRQRERERREAELNAALAELRGQHEAVTAEREEVRARVDVRATETLAAARERWRQEQTEASQRLDFARRWTRGLEAASAAWPERIVHLANVVACTVSALPLDPHFGDKAAPSSFDLLLIEEADQLTEAEFQALARRGARCVLIGEVPRETAVNKAGRSSILRPSVFQRLWAQLHCDPRRLPARWERRGDRLCCQLRPIPADQQRWAEREPVLDRSDVELTIVSPPRSAPILAEVSFPAQTPLDEAKRFIFTEVQELSIQSAAPGCHWTEEGTCLRLHLGGNPASSDTAVPLLEGVTEWVRVGTDNVCHTVALDFCSEAGWHRARAEEWLRSQSSLRDGGRTMVLPRVHRLHPDLSAIIHDLQGEPLPEADCKDVVPSWANWNAPLVFIPVPSRGGPRRSHNGSAPPRQRFEARGAGIEYALEDTAHPPHVPHDLREKLPRQGLVNWMEAEAVVRAVEGLVGDANFRRDQRTPLAVTAMYVAQVRLIHLLLAASPVLRREHVHVLGPDEPPANREGGLCVEVNVPSAWKQRECGGMLVSLTRSHSHRAVAFGEQSSWLPLTLTRARTRLVLFGDPGTLVRRAQWQGALDRLDEATATRERDLVAQLVQYLQGQGLHSDRFQLCEGSGA